VTTSPTTPLVVHLVDGTYELFRQFYGRKSVARRIAERAESRPHPPAPLPEGEGRLSAAAGVLHGVLEMIEKGATHLGVATDHVIESFRNRLWRGYKTGAGVDRALLAQFHPLEEALAAMGVAVWPMVELEADDALASAARLASEDARVSKVCIWTPDKDLGQCVRGERVVQVDRRGGKIRDAAEVEKKFGVPPEFIPDWLALVGDAADGYPGIAGIGAVTAARLVRKYGPIEAFPPETLGDRRDLALLFKDLATLRSDAPLFAGVDELAWRGPTAAFPDQAARLGDERLLPRAEKAAALIATR
jgi:5'-3' exonuclease